ncbi:MAG TPA: DNA/RNA helicase domain-containing protein, partial [Aquella sp.]|nr:DNA/RNA helicase domain-containing protein [Aquella sp.]
SVSEIGCIHTCQGLELEYVGVIIGPDLIVRNGKVITDVSKRSTGDKSIRGYKKLLAKGGMAARDRLDLIVKNTYRTLMSRGLKGCYIYCTDNETADYFKSKITKAEEYDQNNSISIAAEP